MNFQKIFEALIEADDDGELEKVIAIHSVNIKLSGYVKALTGSEFVVNLAPDCDGPWNHDDSLWHEHKFKFEDLFSLCDNPLELITHLRTELDRIENRLAGKK